MKKLSTLDDKDFIDAVRSLYQESADITHKMRKEAIESRKYVAGNQWTEEDLAAREGRPSVTYNRTGPFVDAVVGLYVQNRQEATFLPRTLKDADPKQAEVLNYAAEWVRDQCEAEDEEVDAFIDIVTTGFGATETKLVFDKSPEGGIDEERCDWIKEIFWDCNAKRRNLTDKRWVLRIKPWDKDEIQDEWPDADISGGDWDHGFSFGSEPHRADQAWLYKNDQLQNLPKSVQTVVLFEWFEVEKKHRVIYQGQPIDISVGKFQKLKPLLDQMGMPYTSKPIPKRQYFRAFITGDTLLERGPAPVDGFSIDLITGKRCETSNGYYGIVRSLKDPQRWANVFFSSILHQMATNGKGILAESGTFPNIHKAREQWANPDEIVEVNSGAIREGKIMPKPASPYPEGMDRLMMHTVQSFNDVTGIPVEMLGLTNADQAGIVEAQRRQSGIAIISWAFDAMRKFRKEQARTMSKYILEYLADGRLVRISNEKAYVPLIKQPGMMEYDIIIDDAPMSANQKDRVWAIMQSMLPYMLKMGVPMPRDIFDYLPVPEALKESWKKQMEPDPRQQQKQQQMQEQMHQKQMETVDADIQGKRAKAQLDSAKAQETIAMIGPKRDKERTEAQKNAAETGLKIVGG